MTGPLDNLLGEPYVPPVRPYPYRFLCRDCDVMWSDTGMYSECWLCGQHWKLKHSNLIHPYVGQEYLPA